MITAIHASLAAKREALKKDDRGFTLIELLVVILIIGVLAAIAIPVFIGQVQQSQDSAAEANLANAKTAYISNLVQDSDGLAAGDDGAATLGNYGWPSGGPDVDVIVGGGADAFCLAALSESGAVFQIQGSTGATKVEGATATSGACGAGTGDGDADAG